MAQKYKGGKPSGDCKKVGSIVAGPGWDIYQLAQNETEWENYKLVAKKPTIAKANFWLSFNGQRFSGRKDALILLYSKRYQNLAIKFCEWLGVDLDGVLELMPVEAFPESLQDLYYDIQEEY